MWHTVGSYAMLRSPWGHDFTSCCQVSKWQYWWRNILKDTAEVGSRGRGLGCLMQHHRICCCCKSDGSWLRASCRGWPSSAADSSLAGWQAKTCSFSPLFCACAFGFPIRRWNPVTGRMRPEGVLRLGALFTSPDCSEHAGEPWPLTWHPLHNVLGGPRPGWPLPAPCLKTPPTGKALV